MRRYSDTPNAKRSSIERALWHAFKRTPKRAGFCAWAGEHDPFARVLVRECLMGTPGLYPRVMGAEAPLVGQLAAILRQGSARGELRDDVPAELLALAIVGLTDLALVEQWASDDSTPHRAPAPHLSTLYLGSRHDASPMCANRTAHPRGPGLAPPSGPPPLSCTVLPDRRTGRRVAPLASPPPPLTATPMLALAPPTSDASPSGRCADARSASGAGSLTSPSSRAPRCATCAGSEAGGATSRLTRPARAPAIVVSARVTPPLARRLVLVAPRPASARSSRRGRTCSRRWAIYLRSPARRAAVRSRSRCCV
jgi:hypothetical protein